MRPLLLSGSCSITISGLPMGNCGWSLPFIIGRDRAFWASGRFCTILGSNSYNRRHGKLSYVIVWNMYFVRKLRMF